MLRDSVRKPDLFETPVFGFREDFRRDWLSHFRLLKTIVFRDVTAMRPGRTANSAGYASGFNGNASAVKRFTTEVQPNSTASSASCRRSPSNPVTLQ